ncbi:hypothetical protein K3495_g9483 [Podosphaera aphanis]|nr:hypothetical protein K3495_g9483 [Podosphaera aphanis]
MNQRPVYGYNHDTTSIDLYRLALFAGFNQHVKIRRDGKWGLPSKVSGGPSIHIIRDQFANSNQYHYLALVYKNGFTLFNPPLTELFVTDRLGLS